MRVRSCCCRARSAEGTQVCPAGGRAADPTGSGLNNLKFCENDVNGLAEVLRGQKYNRVIVLTRAEWKARDNDDLEPTAANIRDQLKAILEDRKEGDTVLLAFSGHGATQEGRQDVLLPGKMQPRQTRDAGIAGRSLCRVEGVQGGGKVLLVDACRNDPTGGKAPATAGWPA